MWASPHSYWNKPGSHRPHFILGSGHHLHLVPCLLGIGPGGYRLHPVLSSQSVVSSLLHSSVRSRHRSLHQSIGLVHHLDLPSLEDYWFQYSGCYRLGGFLIRYEQRAAIISITSLLVEEIWNRRYCKLTSSQWRDLIRWHAQLSLS